MSIGEGSPANPKVVVDACETKEWKQKLRQSANRLSVDVFKTKQYYDRRPSSVDATTWYSAGSSVSGASVGGRPASVNLSAGVVGAGGGGAGAGAAVVDTRRSSGIGFISAGSASGSISVVDSEDDRDEVRYSSARMSLIAGAPSPACGGGFGPYETHTDVHYGFQQSLIEKLYGYVDEENYMSPTGTGTDTPPSSSEEILPMSPLQSPLSSCRLPRHTSIFRSFEGWGFEAEDIYEMDPTEEKEINEPVVTQGFRFDASIREAAYSVDDNADEDNVVMAGVDPLESMDASARNLTDSHPLSIPHRLDSNNRNSKIQLKDPQRGRKCYSLHSALGQPPHSSRQHNGQVSTRPIFVGEPVSEGGFITSPYRPSIVLSEIPKFDFSESERDTRNTSVSGSIYDGKPSITRVGTQKGSKISKKSISSSSSVAVTEEPQKRKSFLSFFSGKISNKTNSTSQARVSIQDTPFTPLLHDISEVSSICSRAATPELMMATETSLLKVQRTADGKPRMVPVTARAESSVMRRASLSLQMDDEDVFDNPAPVTPHRERRSSSVYSQHDLIPLRTLRRPSSSAHDCESVKPPRRPSSIYEFDSRELPTLRIRRTSSVYEMDNLQAGEEPSPPGTPWRRYSGTHLSHQDVYIPPRANWYKFDGGLDDNKQLEADARSISSHATGAVKAVLSRQHGSGSRRGSMDYGSYTPDTYTSSASGGLNAPRRKSTEEKMADLSIALRNALKMNDILEEDEYYA